MVLLRRCALIGWSTVSALFAQTGPDVRVTDVEQQFCFMRPDPLSGIVTSRIRLTLRVELKYRNTTRRDLIVPILKNDRVRVADDASHMMLDKEDRPYLYDLKSARVPLDRPQVPYFVIIPAGGDGTNYLGAVITIEPFDRTLFSKELHVHLDRSHATIPPALLRELGAKWSGIGDVWAGAFRLPEFRVRLEEPTKIEACSYPSI